MHHPAGKMLSPHAFLLNDWNDLILQLLQVLLVCSGALHRDQSIKPCLLIAHHAVHLAGWSDISVTL